MGPSPLSLVHLIGSVPLTSSEEVFRRLMKELPGRLCNIPDGETGDRTQFVTWQLGVFPPEILNPFFRPACAIPPNPKNFHLSLEKLGPTKYDKAAIQSYSTFLRLRNEGVIPNDMRFQVSLPTTISPVALFVDHKYAAAVEPLYETRLLEALANIQRGIPAHDLAIQWDLAIDVLYMENEYGTQKCPIFPPFFSPVKPGIVERVLRLASNVHKDVSMGFHLCYGDIEHKHSVEPADMGILVELMNGLNEAIATIRPIIWVHMPVPQDRVDDAYFEPLRQLETEAILFLGLIHAHDEKGTADRISTAKRVLPGRKFGIATECGFGRTPLGDLESIFAISRSMTCP